ELERDPEHPSAAAASMELATIHARQGMFDAAETYQRRAVAIQRRAFGEAHPSLRTGLMNLGAICFYRSDYDCAESSLRESLEMARKLYDPPHYALAESINNLAGLLDQKGQPEAAIGLYRETLEMLLELFPHTDHARVAGVRRNLASTLMNLGRHAEAESLAREALAMRTRLLGSEHTDIVDAERVLAQSLIGQQRWDQAEELLRRSSATSQRIHGDQHWLTAMIVGLHGHVLSSLGQIEAADSRLTSAAEILIDVRGSEAADTRVIAMALIEHLERKGNREAARAWRDRLDQRGRLDERDRLDDTADGEAD
ncbi:MAG: tetratricopeptide repeat protein, partial [Holophagales bacterium]|nr:tetratricopeptide repeat protein [Holophagales bacterium]